MSKINLNVLIESQTYDIQRPVGLVGMGQMQPAAHEFAELPPFTPLSGRPGPARNMRETRVILGDLCVSPSLPN